MHSLNGLAKYFDKHSLVSFVTDPKTGLQGFVAIHRGSATVPAFGATRITSYKNITDALTDALRLSRFMSYKAALAGLPYGGAKGVIIEPKKISHRTPLFKSYAEKINLFDGNFITGADVGVTQADVKIMKKLSPSFVGVSVDPVYYTALGILASARVAVKQAFGSSSFKDRSFAIQGVGKIGGAFLDLIYPEAKKIIVTDTDSKQLSKIKKQYPKIVVVAPQDIYKQEVDVFSPCALGHSLNTKTITKLKAKVIVGGANDQLETPSVGELLHKLGILYAPDYVVNAGGLISVVDEYEHKSVNEKRLTERVNNIGKTVKKILDISQKTGEATNLVADKLAEKIFNGR